MGGFPRGQGGIQKKKKKRGARPKSRLSRGWGVGGF